MWRTSYRLPPTTGFMYSLLLPSSLCATRPPRPTLHAAAYPDSRSHKTLRLGFPKMQNPAPSPTEWNFSEGMLDALHPHRSAPRAQ